MAIKGFKVGSTVHKIDYSAIENPPDYQGEIDELSEEIAELKEQAGTSTGGGISTASANLLCDILADALYGTQATYDKVEVLREMLATGGGDTPDVPDVPVDPDDPENPTVTEYTVTYNLDGYTSDNTQTKVTDGFYTANLTLGDEYDGGVITVSMGGVDITSTVVNGSFILIPEVTGNIVISAVGVAMVNLAIAPTIEHSIVGGNSAGNSATNIILHSGDFDPAYGEIEDAALSAYMTSVRVFGEDRDVIVTLTNTSSENVTQTWAFGDIKPEDIITVENNRKNICHTSYLKRQSLDAGESYSVKVTVHAGYMLAVAVSSHLVRSSVDVTAKCADFADYDFEANGWIEAQVDAKIAYKKSAVQYSTSDNTTQLHSGYVNNASIIKVPSAGTWEILYSTTDIADGASSNQVRMNGYIGWAESAASTDWFNSKSVYYRFTSDGAWWHLETLESNGDGVFVTAMAPNNLRIMMKKVG